MTDSAQTFPPDDAELLKLLRASNRHSITELLRQRGRQNDAEELYQATMRDSRAAARGNQGMDAWDSLPTALAGAALFFSGFVFAFLLQWLLK